MQMHLSWVDRGRSDLQLLCKPLVAWHLLRGDESLTFVNPLYPASETGNCRSQTDAGKLLDRALPLTPPGLLIKYVEKTDSTAH